MGRVFTPEDMAKGRKRVIEEAVRDLSPGVKDTTIRMLESWAGEESEEQLKRWDEERDSDERDVVYTDV